MQLIMNVNSEPFKKEEQDHLRKEPLQLQASF